MAARTFERFRTLHHRPLPFIASKVVLAMVVLLSASGILFAGGASIFGIHWERPWAMGALSVTYGLFAAGLMAFLAALARAERRADVINSMVTIGLSFVGGSMYPARQLPPIFRDHISPLMPNYWFIEGIRGLQSGSDAVWGLAAMKLAFGFRWISPRR